MILRGIYGGPALLSSVRIKAYIEKNICASITNASLQNNYYKNFLFTEGSYSFLNLDTDKNCKECL